MKKNIAIITIILFIIIIICVVCISFNYKKITVSKQQNSEYEQYTKKDIYGTDVVTLIHKAIDNNKKNNVQQDKNGRYIDNNKNSIIIELVMITNENTKKTTTYRMEVIDKVGTNEFITNFNTATFKITDIQYHKQTSKIKYIQISQEVE